MSEPQPPSIPPERPRQPVVSLDGAQTGDVAIGDVAGGDITKTTIINQAKLSPEERQAQRNRAALLGLVRRFWVEGVLHESLHQRVRIELGMQARPDAVDHPWRNIVRLPGQEPQPLAPGQLISAVFAQAGGRLLILGAPGGGKTTTLITLAEQLLNAAAGNTDLPIPVIFQLSTWAGSKPTLTDWLVTELKERYKVPPKVGVAWVETGEILPLLDGLDEVGPSDAERAACIQAINAYLGEAGAQAAVCSRTAEYARLGAKLSLEAAIEVQSLDPAQIDGYLAGFGAPLSGLRTAVAEDTILGHLAASPLLLSVMALAYHNTPAGDLMGQEREVAYQRLWADYVQRRMSVQRADTQTNPQQLRAWLIWLARGMVSHRQQVFYIEYLQPSWLAGKGQRWAFQALSFLVFGLTFGLAFGLVYGMLGGPLFGLVFGLGISVIFGLLGSLSRIQLTETLSWDWQHRLNWQRVRRQLVISLFISPLSVLLLTLMYDLIKSVFFGVLITILFTIIIALFGGSGDVLKKDEIERSIRPNEGIHRSLRNMLIGGLGIGLGISLVSGLSLALVGILNSNLETALVIGLSGGSVIGMNIGLGVGLLQYGGAAVIKHYILRLLLRFRCHTPWNFAATLDEAVSRTLMTRVGGGYRFYHRLLQEHFAEHAQSGLPIAPILGPQPGDTAAGRRAQG